MTLDTPRARNLALALLAMTQFVIVIDARFGARSGSTFVKMVDFKGGRLN